MINRSRARRRSLPVENAGQVDGKAARMRYSRGLIEQTKAVWQPYYDHVLTDEDAREIIEHMVSFVRDLAACRVAAGKGEANDAREGVGDD